MLRTTAHGQPELIHYGPGVTAGDAAALAVKNTSAYGCAVNYDEADELYSLDAVPLVWSGGGRGDYRESPAELETAAGRSTDFVCSGHRIEPGTVPAPGLPQARDGGDTLVLTMADAPAGAELELYFTVFEEADVITRRTVLKNTGTSSLTVRKLMSSMLDLPGSYMMTTLDGGWIAEAHRHDAPVGPARVVNEAVTGMSSNRHNPGFLLWEPEAGEDHGRVYGFNLVWSGNHYASAQQSLQGLTRVMQGVSPADFARSLAPGESFYTPEAVMSFSEEGFNGLSAHMHDFVNRHIVPPYWQGRERPVLYNSWEGCGFQVSERRLEDLARSAAKLGCELFVLDDGWFGARSSDKAGLAAAQAVLAVRSGAACVKCAVGGDTVSLDTFGSIIKNYGNDYGLTSNLRQTELHRTVSQINWITDNAKNDRSTVTVSGDFEGIRLDKNDTQEAVLAAVAKLGYDLSDEDAAKVYEEFLRVAAKKNVGAKELDAIVASAALQVPSAYKLISYIINNGNIITASAHIVLERDGKAMEGIELGDGPIDASFIAIDRIIGRHYELDDFQIQAVTEGKEAMGSAVVKLRSGGKLYSGNGISTDIIGASIRAYLNAINKIVYEEAQA